MFARRIASIAPSTSVRFAAAAPATDKRSKMQTLHKILTGELPFKNKAPVKESNVELMFGAGWKQELQAYAGQLPAEEKKVLDRQVARLALTRYTTRELAQFAGNGPAGVDAAAKAFMLCEGVKMLSAQGEAAFKQHVEKEAAVANWSASQAADFIKEVKAAKK